MKVWGYSLLAISLLIGLATKFMEPNYDWGYAVFLGGFFIGGLLLLIDVSLRLWRRDVILRPFDAIRKAAWLFLLIFGGQILLRYLISGQGVDVTAALINSMTFALAFGLHSTAYRRRA